MSFSKLEYQQSHFSKIPDSKIIVHNIHNITQLSYGTRLLTTIEYVGPSLDSLYGTDGQMMVYLKMNDQSLNPGDRIISSANYELEKSNTNPHVFDYKQYLNRRNIYHRIRLDTSQYHRLDTKENSDLFVKAKQKQTSALQILERHLANDDALAVAAAMILGERNLLKDELYNAFTNTGAVHVLAVSGLHVGIVSVLLLFFLNKIKLKLPYIELGKSVILVSAIWSFALVTGMAAAVTRAALMFTLFYLGRGIGRKRNPYNTLAMAALVMIIMDPNYIYQAGFQFSFLALLGIIYFYPPIYRSILIKNPILKKVWALIVVSIAAQALVSPLAIYYFHKLPMYFWFTGIIAVPAATIILWLGLGLIFSSWYLGDSSVVTIYAGKTLNKLIEIFNLFIFKVQSLPYCSAEDLWLSKTSLTLIYSAILAIALFIKFKNPKFLNLAGLLLIIQISGHIIEKHKSHKISKLVIYDNYKGSLVDVFHSGRVYTLASEELDERSIDFVSKNNRLYNRVVEKKNLGTAFSSKEGFHLIDDKLYLLNPSKEVLQYCSDEPIEILLLSDSSYNNLYKLSDRFEINKVIVDGTMKYQSRKIKRAAENLGINIHETFSEGAFQKVI